MPSFLRISRTAALWLLAIIALQLLFLSAAASAQGFGSSKKKVVLHRKLPPTAHISGTGIKVEVASQGIEQDVPQDLKSMLEAELLKDDSRLRLEDKNADTLITCTVTQYSQPTPQSSTRSVYEIGSKKPQNETVTRYTGLLTVAYQAKDRHSGRILDSANITAKFDDEFNQNGSTKGGITSGITGTFGRLKHGRTEADTPPTPAELKNKLLNDAVSQIASRLVNTDELVEVLLARGHLDDANKQAEAGLWTRNLETLETMTPLSSKEDDAYRLYNIGVAYEALAYASEDPKAAKQDLANAAINYGKAIDAKPSEKYFLTPQTRIDTAIAHYKKLSESGSVSASNSKSTGGTSPSSSSSSSSTRTHSGSMTSSTSKSTGKAASPSGGGSTAKAAAKGPTLTNDQVIALVKANVDEENIIDTIRTAASVDFDLSVNGEINLAKNGVKGKILTAMKTRARQGTTHRASSQ
jgi:hypothetical protein